MKWAAAGKVNDPANNKEQSRYIQCHAITGYGSQKVSLEFP